MAMEGPDVSRVSSSRTSCMERESSPSTLQSRTASASDEHGTGALNAAPFSKVDDPETKPPTLNLQIECSPHMNSTNAQNGTRSRTALIFGSLSTTISAGLYIFNFVGNVLLVKQYYDFDYRSKDPIEGLPEEYTRCPAGKNFITMVSFMVIGHIGWGIAFMTADLPKKEYPLLSGYFFPLVQFQRLLRNVWQPLGKDSRAQNSSRAEALYAIVSAAIDGGPLLVIQYTALATVTMDIYWEIESMRDSKPWSWTPGAFLIVSLLVSAVSAAYNVIQAMVFIIPIRSVCLGLATGLLTLSTLTLQCTTLTCLVLAAATYSTAMNYIMLAIYVLLTVFIPLIGFYFLIWQISSQSTFRTVAKSICRAAGFAYVSVSFGSFYPLINVARTNSTILLSTKRFRFRLFLFAAYQMMLEATFVLLLTQLKDGFSPCSSNNVSRSRSPLMTCSIYSTLLIGGFGLEISSLSAFVLLVRSDPGVGLQIVNTPDSKTLQKVDGGFSIFEASFNFVNSCWGS